MLMKCRHCQASLKVPQELLGKQVRCPKCGQTSHVAEAPPDLMSDSSAVIPLPEELFLKPPAKASTPPTARPLPSTQTSGVKPPAKPSQPPAIPHVPATVAPKAGPGKSPPSSPRMADAQPAIVDIPIVGTSYPGIQIDNPGIQIDTTSSSRTSRASRASSTRPRAAKKPISQKTWLAIGGGAGAVLIACVVVYLATRSGPAPATGPGLAAAPATAQTAKQSPAARSETAPQSSPPAVAPGEAALVLHWPEADRKGAAVTIDGKKQSLPVQGPIQFGLAAGDHRVVLQRRGYEQIEVAFSLKSGDKHTYTPEWQKSFLASAAENVAAPAPVGFAGWGQNLAVAEHSAKPKNREILLVFAGSDWEATTRELAERVFASREFMEHAKDRFELVVIDFPRTRTGFNLVPDRAQNNALADRYNIKTVPMLVLTDPLGVPYARTQPKELAPAEFVGWLVELQKQRQERDRLIAAAQQGDDATRLAASAAAVKWLLDQRLSQFQKQPIADWLKLAERADAGNEAGHHEVVFHGQWINEVIEADRDDAATLKRIVESLERWAESRKFHDPDRGAKLFGIAARIMLNLEDETAAMRLATTAQQHRAKDAQLAEDIESLVAMLKDREQLGSGTGFVVGTEGFILTNHHVIDGPGRVVVRLPGVEEAVPAQVIAKEEKVDLALLKIAPEKAGSLTPLQIDAAPLSRGARVAAFGYPLADIVGKGIKLTTGVVSSLPEEKNGNMLVLDCRVNPGNSGGPLCSTRGNVVGIVTAKSFSGDSVDSYGMAVPAEELIKFLSREMAGYERPTVLEDKTLEWDVVDNRVSPSVVMVVKLR
jgi:predicted Zn finger-like uncharacterized protein